MLTGKNIYKSYGPLTVLNGVDLTIQKGEIVSIVGPSGSGKSTLLHILGTLDRADMGDVEIRGVRVLNLSENSPVPVSWVKRLVHHVLDTFLIGFLAGLLLYVSGIGYSFGDDAFTWVHALFFLLTLVGYYIVFEGLTGRSPAKYLTGSKVMVQADGTRPGFRDSIIRTLCRLIPFDNFSFLSRRPQGWHDILSGTIVTGNATPYKQKSSNSISGKQLSAFRNRHIGFVFQFHHLLPEFTALENVCIPGWLAGRKKSEVKAEAERLLSMLGLSERLDNKPGQLSGGEQQRVAVARALINQPDIIFADEPTGNLDTANAKELHQLFFDLRKQFNQTFLIVTHNEELARLSDRVLHMKDGRIVDQTA